MYQKTFVASVLFFALSLAQEEEDGPKELTVILDGKRKTVFVQTTSWSDIDTIGKNRKELELEGNNRMFFTNSEDPTDYFTPDLLGGFVSFQVDLSKIGCNCVTNFMGVTLPSTTEKPEDPYRDCARGDANCPTYNMMTANQYGFTSSQRRCFDEDGDGVYESCDDKWGCSINVHNDSRFDDPYGPSSEFRLDTTKPFIVKSDIQEGGDGLWTAMRTVLGQKKGKKWKSNLMTKGDCPYLQSSSAEAMDGFAFVLQTYQTEDAWINDGKCESETICDPDEMFAAFSNFRFSTKGAAKAPLDWNKYIYGEFCDEDDQQFEANECEEHTGECRWSYPSHDEDEWDSEDVACRTLPKQRAPEGYAFDEEACDDDDPAHCGDCDRDQCKWSWPKEDPFESESKEAFCRCQPQEVEYVFSDEYGLGTNNYIGECGADCGTCQWSWPKGDEDKQASQDAAFRCKPETIKEIVFGSKCRHLNQGECGNYCKDCNWSWYPGDNDFDKGESAACRCKTWWGVD